MIGRISNIARVAHGSYRVTLETQNGDAIGSFVLHVLIDGEIRGLRAEDDFISYLGPQSPPIKELLNAVFAFDDAQTLKLPPWEEYGIASESTQRAK